MLHSECPCSIASLGNSTLPGGGNAQNDEHGPPMLVARYRSDSVTLLLAWSKSPGGPDRNDW